MHRESEHLHLHFDSENLAVPEVRTGEVEALEMLEPEEDELIQYDTLAVPEVHVHKQVDAARERKE